MELDNIETVEISDDNIEDDASSIQSTRQMVRQAVAAPIAADNEFLDIIQEAVGAEVPIRGFDNSESPQKPQ